MTYSEMKDSGVEWLGDIPADWEVIISRFVFDQIGDVDHYMPESVDNGISYIMTGDLKKILSDIDFNSCKKISDEDYLKLSKKIKLVTRHGARQTPPSKLRRGLQLIKK